MKVLIVSGGGFQGQTLLNIFRALRAAEIHIADIHLHNVTKIAADRYVTCPAIHDEDKFIRFVDDYIQNEQIDYIVPSTDWELSLLSKYRNRWKAETLVSEPSLLEILRNKLSTHQFVESNGLPGLQTFASASEANFWPLYRKPIVGFGGKNHAVIASESDFREMDGEESLYVYQEFIKVFDEFSIDVFIGRNDFSEPLIRKRVRSSGGFAVVSKLEEVDAQTLKVVIQLVQLLCEKGAYGFFNIQFMSFSGRIAFTDINPRVGTSSVLAHFITPKLLSFFPNKTSQRTFRSPDISHNKPSFVYRRLHDRAIPILNLKEFSAICFDLDDTLMDHRAWVNQQFQSFVAKLELQEFQKAKVLLTGAMAIEESKVYQLIDLLISEHSEILPAKESLLDIYRASIPNHVRLMEGAHSLVSQLHEAGLKVFILTDNPPAHQRKKIELLPFRHLIHKVFYAEETGFRKPHEACFELVKQDADISTVAFVGDNFYRDILGSLNAGFKYAFHLKRPGGFVSSSSEPIHGNELSDKYHNIESLTELMLHI